MTNIEFLKNEDFSVWVSDFPMDYPDFVKHRKECVESLKRKLALLVLGMDMMSSDRDEFGGLHVKVDFMPTEMKMEKQWMIWKLEKKLGQKKLTKIPFTLHKIIIAYWRKYFFLPSLKGD